MPSNSPGGNGWQEWSRYVLKELEHGREASESLRQEVVALRTDFASQRVETHTKLAVLKVQAGLWGAAGAALPVILLIAIQFLTP